MTETPSITKKPKKHNLLRRAGKVLTRQIDKSTRIKNKDAATSQEFEQLKKQLKQQEIQLRKKNHLLQRTQHKLSKAREEYDELYNLSPIGCFNLSRKGVILNANIKAAELLGRELAQIVNKPLSSFVHHGSLHTYYDFITDPRVIRPPSVCELKFVRQHGVPFEALLEVSCRRNKRGAITDFMVLLSDITESKEYEHALLAEMDRAQVTLHSIGDGVITTDADGIIDYMNPVAEHLTGWSTQMAIGNRLQTVFHVVDEKSQKPIANAVQRCLKANQIITLGEDCVLVGKHGQKFAIQHSIAPLKHRNGTVLGIVVVFSNVTEARNMAQQLVHQATHDSLTGLVNRREFEKRLGNAIKGSKSSRTHHCLCYLDLDQFKIVNDTAGHVAGDELLRRITVLLKSKIRSRDTLARYGGDEFGLLLDNCPIERAYSIAKSLLAAVQNLNFEWEGRTFQVGVSIGLVPITEITTNTAEIMSQADVACYTAKDLGRNQVHIYENTDNKLAQRHSEILRVADITDSIKANRFRLYCQSISPLQETGNEAAHYELLIRAVDANGKIELPKTFIPAAERYGMMAAIDRWVIRTAFRRYVELFDQSENIKIAINISGNSLTDASFLQYVQHNISKSGIRSRNVCFEITETAAISNLEQARIFITELKQLGCQFALDDFGSGLSSFTYLKNLPVDYLKIDGSFVSDMINDPINQAMVAAINEVGHVMGIKTIAECAENHEIIDQLTKLGVDYAQGFAISTPMPIEVVASRLTQLKTVSI
jgi:diguanylate cyclase (GGDEF)-like protein/PAS domain S-box-containing protein